MITVDEKLIVTKQINEVLCRYAKRNLIKEFLFTFSFPNCSKENSKLKAKHINPLLETIYYYQGDIYPDTLVEVENYINTFLNELDENDLTALQFLTLNENYLIHIDDFENEDGSKYTKEEFEEKLGRYFAHKLYEPEKNGLNEELQEMLQNQISRLANEIDLSVLNKESISEILDAIELITE
ncbi:hypothetical protein [Flavobacterium haoranii]|uniref:Uncharacterized protein n=1 Tax=Flavobacterium haoranii TaxID=683124 RepID=A0A1M6J6P5_9FLAO|nr:hypothetical protein [Flavobacterium haoranii]SHJ42330.1 hypothetical protein SAMN05444337_1984 [Flavobacterium haoranii]